MAPRFPLKRRDSDDGPINSNRQLLHVQKLIQQLLNQEKLYRWGLATFATSRRLLARLSNYIHEHPYLFALQVFGVLVLFAACITLPVLAGMGFSAAGPVAGSAAAAWQAEIGIVGAGTLFAWCQSVAMGGAAVGAITTTGVLGAAMAIIPNIAHTVAQEAVSLGSQIKQKLWTMWSR